MDVSYMTHDQNIYPKTTNKSVLPPNKKFACPVKYRKHNVAGRIPQDIWYAELDNPKDISHCIPIIRTITFIEKNTKCFSNLGKRMIYIIKTKQYIVDYKHMSGQSTDATTGR